jgi:hypothetical protein
MGNTYRKERSFDDRRNNKKRVAADVDRKHNKNHRLADVVYEDEDDIEFDDFEDYYESEELQHYTKK